MKNWIIMPWINNSKVTIEAAESVLAQDIESPNLLLIANGVTSGDRYRIENWITQYQHVRVHPWWHNPTLQSLAATWNLALDFVWAQGAEYAWNCNNDIVTKPDTYRKLVERMKEDDALFVSAVGVNEETWNNPSGAMLQSKGGPDYSCYAISKECHKKYRFDENFIPAYLEDCDNHRTIMLAGEGHRIYSIDVPYLHYASGSLKAMNPIEREQVEKAITEGSRTYYTRKWGGDVNSERFLIPFGPAPQGPDFCTSNPQIQRHGCRGWH